jgi:dihydroflavonol-4-reductase
MEINLVTGATGRTGPAVCAELKKRGKYVRAMAHVEDKRSEMLRPLVDELVVADITKPETLDAAFKDVTYCYHLAGVVSIASKISPALRATNVDGTRNVVEACLKHKVRRLVETGTCHTVPFHDKKSILREPNTHEGYHPEQLHGSYAITKAEGSNIVLDAIHNRGLNAVIIMPVGIVGGFEYKLSNMGQLVAMCANGTMPCCVHGGYNWVDVKDVAWAAAELCEKGVLVRTTSFPANTPQSAR